MASKSKYTNKKCCISQSTIGISIILGRKCQSGGNPGVPPPLCINPGFCHLFAGNVSDALLGQGVEGRVARLKVVPD